MLHTRVVRVSTVGTWRYHGSSVMGQGEQRYRPLVRKLRNFTCDAHERFFFLTEKWVIQPKHVPCAPQPALETSYSFADGFPIQCSLETISGVRRVCVQWRFLFFSVPLSFFSPPFTKRTLYKEQCKNTTQIILMPHPSSSAETSHSVSGSKSQNGPQLSPRILGSLEHAASTSINPFSAKRGREKNERAARASDRLFHLPRHKSFRPTPPSSRQKKDQKIKTRAFILHLCTPRRDTRLPYGLSLC